MTSIFIAYNLASQMLQDIKHRKRCCFERVKKIFVLYLLTLKFQFAIAAYYAFNTLH